MAQPQSERLWNRNFILLWVGLVQSYFGDSFLAVGLIWLVLERTNSPTAAATILALQALPRLIGPVAGVIVDRTNKQILMIGCDVARGVVLFAVFVLYLGGVLEVWHLYLLVVVLGALSIFYTPSLRVLLPAILAPDRLPAANSAIQFGQQSAMIIGASLSGVALAVVGAPFALLIDAISFILAAVLLLFVRFPVDLLHSADIGARQVWRDLIAGLRYIFTTKEVIALTILAFLLNLILSPVNIIFPIFSKTVLGEGLVGFGLLASCISGGLLLGSVVAGVVGDRLHYTRAIIISLVGMGLALTGLGNAQTLLPALALTAGLGLMAPIMQVPLTSRLQRSVPREYQGRVFATLETLVTLAIPLAAALTGQALVTLPVAAVFRIAGIALVVVAGIWWLVAVRGQSRPAAQTIAEV